MKWPQPLYLISGILLVIAIHIFASAPQSVALGPWLDKWQTLIAGVLALIGAWLAIAKVSDQITQVDRIEVKRLFREHQAVRATLPLTLSAICNWSSETAVELNKLWLEMHQAGEQTVGAGFSVPMPPADQVNEIQQVIRSTEDHTVIKPLSEIIREIQTLWARINEIADLQGGLIRVGILEEIDSHIMQAGKIYALAGSLFEYARGASESGPREVAWDLVSQFLVRHRIGSEIRFGSIERQAAVDAVFWKLDGEYWKQP